MKNFIPVSAALLLLTPGIVRAVQPSTSQILKGLEVALLTRKINNQSPFHRAIILSIEAMQKGQSLDDASNTHGLNPRVFSKLAQLGSNAAPVATKPQTNLPKETQSTSLIERIEALESRVGLAETKIASLDEAQNAFLAELSGVRQQVVALEAQQTEFLAFVVQKPNDVAIAQKPEPKVKETSDRSVVDKIPAPSIAPAQPNSIDNPHTVANALARALVHPDAKKQVNQQLKGQVHNAIRRLRREETDAIGRSGIPDNSYRQLLAWGGLSID